MGQKFSTVTTGSTITATTYFFAAVYNGVSWVNAGNKFTIATLSAAVSTENRVLITSTVNSATIVDAFFATAITAIFTSNQSYLIDVDFTQDTGATSITGIGGLTFSIDQVILATR